MLGKTHSALIIAIAMSFTGCSTFEGYPSESTLPPGTTLSSLDKDLDEWVTLYEKTDYSQRADVRNNLLRRQMIVADLAYEKFERAIYVQNLRGTVYTDWTTNLLTSASPATDHIPTRNVLAGLSTILSGGKAIYESNVISKGVMSALIAEMRTSREEVRNRIRERTALPASQYDLYDALADLNDYKVAGSLPSAVAGLNARANDEQDAVAETTNRVMRNSLPPVSNTPRTSFATPTDISYEEAPVLNMGTPIYAESPAPASTPTSTMDTPPLPQPTETPVGTYTTTQQDLSKWVNADPNNRRKLEEWLKPKRVSIDDFLTKDKHENLRIDALATFGLIPGL